MLQKIRWFFVLVGLTLVLLLLLWNSSVVTVKFPFVLERQLPLSILLFTTASISFVLGSIVTGWTLRRRHKAAIKAEAAKSKLNQKSESTTPNVLGSQAAASETAGQPLGVRK